MPEHTNLFSFKLLDGFIEKYQSIEPPFGYSDAGNNSFGEVTFIRSYSRKKADGTKEQWYEVCRRVIEGMYSIQKNHCRYNRLPWNHNKAQKSAQEAYDRLFNLKWTPPGRGLWMMGTEMVMLQENSSGLQNCSFISTHDMDRNSPGKIYGLIMEQLMLGIGVGYDDKGALKDFSISEPGEEYSFVIPDTREGWAEALERTINSYLKPNQKKPVFDYSEIRPYGTPIKTFGGTASGPDPLIKLITKVDEILSKRVGNSLTGVDIADIVNLIGVCVVSGNVRRSATLIMGNVDDEDFINLKNAEVFPERNSTDPENPGWSWMSNNSVEVKVGSDLSHIVEGIARNGEPGVIWLDTAKKYGRLNDAPDNKDYRIAGFNPCAEQGLESQELCTLSECYITRHDSVEDLKRSLKFAFLYAKTVTLLPTHWPETNAIMQRNRRIGTSISGIADFADNNGLPELRTWLDEGYEALKEYDKSYSEWLCVRESVKISTVKPSGTVSLLAGASPGVHWPAGGEYFLRAIRLASNDALVNALLDANYWVEPDVVNPETTVVAYFPIHSNAKRSEKEVSIFEKIALAATAQKYWSDNSVSVTVTFDSETEADHVGTVLHMYDGQLKTVSFLPMGNDTYPQMPYTKITKEEYEKYEKKLKKVDMSILYSGDTKDAEGEAYCTTDKCLI